ncbi:Inositol 1,4,5-trisphosphate receptor type 2 [Galemys pyrenaicus]|uniref:Inositol 1,4,5-trisphosphate receptor type 2 n=1 Tax=Galemys pyrenaicus TaxID=202257 RepID=A0A8J6DPQ3_GALPY|nr:Inositol 1,4,5-trisphosphate receptor type 2 [Galemys pyrenaicus]
MTKETPTEECPEGHPSRHRGAGLERDKFDNKTVSFEEHIKSEHNMWHYLYFLVLVKVKDPTEYTGPESYVAQMIVFASWRAGTVLNSLGQEKQRDAERDGLWVETVEGHEEMSGFIRVEGKMTECADECTGDARVSLDPPHPKRQRTVSAPRRSEKSRGSHLQQGGGGQLASYLLKLKETDSVTYAKTSDSEGLWTAVGSQPPDLEGAGRPLANLVTHSQGAASPTLQHWSPCSCCSCVSSPATLLAADGGWRPLSFPETWPSQTSPCGPLLAVLCPRLGAASVASTPTARPVQPAGPGWLRLLRTGNLAVPVRACNAVSPARPLKPNALRPERILVRRGATEKNLDWFPRMRAMSLVCNEGDSEQNEIRSLQEKLESTMSLVKQLSGQLAELKEQMLENAEANCGPRNTQLLLPKLSVKLSHAEENTLDHGPLVSTEKPLTNSSHSQQRPILALTLNHPVTSADLGTSRSGSTSSIHPAGKGLVPILPLLPTPSLQKAGSRERLGPLSLPPPILSTGRVGLNAHCDAWCCPGDYELRSPDRGLIILQMFFRKPTLFSFFPFFLVFLPPSFHFSTPRSLLLG